jgi:Dyp-type peroxidase family
VTAMVDLSEIQGNIVRSYGRSYRHAHYLFLRARDGSAETHRALVTVLAHITFGDPMGGRVNGGRRVTKASAGSSTDDSASGRRHSGPPSCVNISFTYSGLEHLQVPDQLLRDLPEAFRVGAAGRAEDLGDHWQCRCADRLLPRKGQEPHLLVSVHGKTEADVTSTWEKTLWPVLAPHFDSVHDVLANGDSAPGRDHFGFADGLSQPAIEGIDIDPVGDGVYAVTPRRAGGARRLLGLALEDLGLQALSRKWRLIRPGEILLGYENEDGNMPEGSTGPLGPNSTFMVYREIDENVDVFNEYITKNATAAGLSEDHLRAKIVGRWPNGTSAMSQRPGPDDEAGDSRRLNDFRYGDDPHGYACPLGAHTRRANARDGLPGGGEEVMRHRIIRRGMPYSLDADSPNGARKGLAFVCFCASIENGFEYIQRHWINAGEAFGLGSQRDFLLQDWAENSDRTPMVIPGYRPAILEAPDEQFVKVRGCEYLFVPSRSACRWLSDNLTAPQESPHSSPASA